MSIEYKWNRVRRWSRVVGLWEALRFELIWTIKTSLVYIRVPGYHKPFTIRRQSSDLCVFEMIFIDKELDYNLPSKPRLIIDGGANVG
jgi:hypothetical protein